MNARDAIISIMAASPQFADLDPMVLRTIAARCRPKVFLTGDSNFGFVLPWWDRMFGTYQPELPSIKIRYGLSHPRSSPSNPFVIAYEELWRMVKELASGRGWQTWYRSVLGPPA